MVSEVPKDTRGILDPAAMMRHVDFNRYPAGAELDGLVEWFWTVQWDLPAGMVHQQHVLSHPAGNVSIGTIDAQSVTLDPAEGRVCGVISSISQRHLIRSGWTIAARTSVGGLGVILGCSARTVADTEVSLNHVLPDSEAFRLVKTVIELNSNDTRNKYRTNHSVNEHQVDKHQVDKHQVDKLKEALVKVVARRDSTLIDEAREIVEVAKLAELDRAVRRVDQLASAAGVSVRSLQRLFDIHVGASPAFVIRRWRIIEAAEAARVAAEDGLDWAGWATGCPGHWLESPQVS